MTRKKDYQMIEEIMGLLYVEKKEKRSVALEISEKYQVSTTTVYRNMETINEVIKNQIKIIELLQSSEIEASEFKEDLNKIREALR